MIRFLVLTAATLVACGGSEGETSVTSGELADSSLARRDVLGWLGARSQPVTAALDFSHDGERRSPGGVVVREIDDGGPLARAGARVGDVLVRVDDEWVPLKSDPTLDLIELVERAVSGERDDVRLAAWRSGEIVDLVLPIDRPALEVGLPVEVERFRAGAAAAVARLVAAQRSDGGWDVGAAEDELAVDALAALALVSAGARADDAPEAERRALDAAVARVDALVTEPTASPHGLALATCLAAEGIGPLPAEILVDAAPRAGPGSGALPAGPHGVPAGAEMQVMTIGPGGELPDGITLPEGFELPEGATIQISGTPPAFRSEAPSAAGPAPAESAGADLATLLADADPDRAAELERLGVLVDSLVAAQAEDGGWGADGRLVVTSTALVALGSAQRVGLELDPEPVQAGCAFLRALVHDGKVASAVARGADRRDESGRAATVAWAFLALGCPETDPFVQGLIAYSDEGGRHLVDGTAAVREHALSTGVLRRRRGLLTWQRFYDEFRIPLVAWQTPSGSFSIPAGRDAAAGGEIADTAVGVLLLSLQEERLAVLLGEAENPFAPVIDGEGQRPGAGGAAEEEAETMTEIGGPDEIRKLLESTGIEIETGTGDHR